MSEQPMGPGNERLESWKAIAAYLNRDARTVMRWEKFEALPVHRQRHLSRSTVYAYPHELDAWRRNRRIEPPEAAPSRSKLRFVAVAAMLAIGVVSGGGGLFFGPVTALQAGPNDRRLNWPGDPSLAYGESMSSDGRYAAYTDLTSFEITVRDLHSGHAHTLTKMGGADGWVDHPVVSNDDRQVAFYAADKKTSALFVLPIDATGKSKPRHLLDGDYIWPRHWSADDRQILVTIGHTNDQSTDIALVAADTGERRVLQHVPFPGVGEFLAWSPDGRFVAYDQRAEAGHRQRDLWIVGVDDGVAKPLLTGPTSDSAVAWSPDGKHVVFRSDRVGSRGDGLWALPVRGGNAAGDPILLKADFQGVPASLTRAGTLFFERGNGANDILIAPLNPDAPTKPAPEQTSHDPIALNARPRWSADGHWLTYGTQRPGGPVISRRDIQSGAVTEVPMELNAISTFDLSPDGSRIVCRGLDLDQHNGIFMIDTATGAVAPIVLWQPGVTRQFVPQFTADGQSITYVVGDYHHNNQIVERNLTTGATRTVATLPPNSGNNLRRSLDGRYVLTVTSTDAPAETTLRLFDTIQGQARDVFRIGRESGVTEQDGVQWTPDGHAIVANLRGAADNTRELWWIPIDGSQPHRLDVGVSNIVDSGIAIDPAGQHIAFVAGDPSPSRQHEFHLLEHFLPAR